MDIKKRGTHSMEFEFTYLDHLIALQEDVSSDVIPEKEKIEILNLIAKLESKLEKYSA